MAPRTTPRVWVLFYANGGLAHLDPGQVLEEFPSIMRARDELAIRFATGNGHATYSCGGKGAEYTVWPDHDPRTCYALVWLATGRTLPPGQAPDATSAPDEKWTPGRRGGLNRTSI